MKITDEEMLQAMKSGRPIMRKNWQKAFVKIGTGSRARIFYYDIDGRFKSDSLHYDDLAAEDWRLKE